MLKFVIKSHCRLTKSLLRALPLHKIAGKLATVIAVPVALYAPIVLAEELSFDAVESEGFIPEHLPSSLSPLDDAYVPIPGMEGAPVPGGLLGVRNVFSVDDRKPMTSSSYPWSAVGRISSGKWSCTGSLIAKDLVLTNAHCVVDEATASLTKQRIWFYPNFKNGRAKAKAYATQIWHGTNQPGAHRGKDWAILRLSEPLGEDFGYLGWKVIDFSNPQKMRGLFKLVGYSGDFQRGMTAGVHANCSVTREDKRRSLLLHDCDSTGGSSGGPILATLNRGAGAQIVGLHAAARLKKGGAQFPQGIRYSDQAANLALKVENFRAKLEAILSDR